MKYKLILLLLTLPFFMKAQIVKERDVIAAGGSSSSSGELQLDYTIAELSVDMLSAAGLTLTQGFNQPQGFFVSILEMNTNEITGVYPNPFRDQINIVLADEITDCSISIIDFLGRIMPGSVYELLLNAEGSIQIDCSNYPPGIYAVRIIHDTTKREECYKIIKTN